MEGAAWRQGGQLFPAFVFAPRADGDDGGGGGGGDGGMGENRYWGVKDFDWLRTERPSPSFEVDARNTGRA